VENEWLTQDANIRNKGLESDGRTRHYAFRVSSIAPAVGNLHCLTKYAEPVSISKARSILSEDLKRPPENTGAYG
jgi:hypothetical protein